MLTRYLLGTSEVCEQLCPGPYDETLPVTVDSDWADDKLLWSAVLTWARTRKTRALSSAEAELYGICSRAVEGLGAAQLFTKMAARKQYPFF